MLLLRKIKGTLIIIIMLALINIWMTGLLTPSETLRSPQKWPNYCYLEATFYLFPHAGDRKIIVVMGWIWYCCLIYSLWCFQTLRCARLKSYTWNVAASQYSSLTQWTQRVNHFPWWPSMLAAEPWRWPSNLGQIFLLFVIYTATVMSMII